MNTQCKFCNKVFPPRYKNQIYCSVLCSNRFNLNNKRPAIIPRKQSKELAELFGILLGDGSITKYYVKIYLNRIADKKYYPYIIKLSRKLFPNIPVTHKHRIQKGTTEIQISSKDVCDYLKSVDFDPKIRYVPFWIIKNINFIKATIRGLIDTEGSVGIKYFKGKKSNRMYKQLTFTNKNKFILQFMEKSLEKLGYRPTKSSNKNIYISNRKDITKYLDEIGSNNPKIIRKIETKKVKGFSYGGLRRMVRH